MPNLKIKNISYSYKEKSVLNDVSFEVLASELVCLVGPSGCGKSTLLRIIAGLNDAKSGDIKFGDKSIANLETKDRNIGIVFQHPSLFPHLTVYENVGFGLRKLDKIKRKEICHNMLKLIGLQNQSDKYPHQLSGGQHQRVALARSLAPSPKIMLLDEPFANLDYILRSEIRDEVVSILKKIKVPTIMVTHSPEEALIIADKMVLLNNRGKVHQIGEPDIMHNHPVDVESAAFFGSVSKIPAVIEGNYIISALGKLDKKTYAPNFENGEQVLIVTRPEGIRIAKENEECTMVKIDFIRHTGAGWLVNASLENSDKIIYHHIYGEPPKKMSKVCVTFDPPHIFVFKK